MGNNLMFELKPHLGIETDCESVTLEIINPENEIDAKLDEINNKISGIDISVDKYTNHADNIDYAIAVASGILTGLFDAIFIDEIEIDLDKIQKILEKQYHTANDDEFKHKNKHGNQISSSKYHRLQDLAHHPTPLGLIASILVRYFRLVIYTDGSDNKPHIFFADAPNSENTKKAEQIDLIKAWTGAIIGGLFAWLALIAEKKLNKEYNNELPDSLRRIIEALGGLPILIEKFKCIDMWLGHIMSDVSTPQGISGFFLSLRYVFSVDKQFSYTLYNNGEKNLPKWSGATFVAVKKQSIPVLINEVLTRGFYFIRHLILEYKNHKNLKNINWDNVFPFSNRTVERMMTIASGTFSAFDFADATIRSGGLNSSLLLRLNFVGIGRFTVALGTDVYMGWRKDKLSKERMLLKADSLYLLEAKIYHGEALMWSALKNANESIDSLLETIQLLTSQISANIKAVQNSITEIEQIDISLIEEKNQDLIEDLLNTL